MHELLLGGKYGVGVFFSGGSTPFIPPRRWHSQAWSVGDVRPRLMQGSRLKTHNKRLPRYFYAL